MKRELSHWPLRRRYIRRLPLPGAALARRRPALGFRRFTPRSAGHLCDLLLLVALVDGEEAGLLLVGELGVVVDRRLDVGDAGLAVLVIRLEQAGADQEGLEREVEGDG